jgi:hypothetical protein
VLSRDGSWSRLSYRLPDAVVHDAYTDAHPFGQEFQQAVVDFLLGVMIHDVNFIRASVGIVNEMFHCLVCLVLLVYLVCLVCLVCLVLLVCLVYLVLLVCLVCLVWEERRYLIRPEITLPVLSAWS